MGKKTKETRALHALEDNLEWKSWQKFAFRVFFIYFLALIVPIDPSFYKDIINIDWQNISQRDLHKIAIYFPWFANNPSEWDFSGMFLAFFISIILAIIWSLLNRDQKNYTKLHYWLNVLLRYRIALAMFHFGWAKAIPVQMGFPSLSALNTNLGDFATGKLFRLTVGSAPPYEIFSGIMELTGALLLLSRKTTLLGVIWLIAVMTPVTAINFSYDYGVHMKCVNIMLMLLFLLTPHFKNLYALLIKLTPSKLEYSYPKIANGWFKPFKISIQVIFVAIFFVFYGYLVGRRYLGYEREPKEAKINIDKGYYHVTDFKLNNIDIPYSPRDSTRWQNVVVEQNTISIKQAAPLKLLAKNKFRGHENFSTAGRHYFKYSANSEGSFVLYKIEDKKKENCLST